jgi:peroxiredoxin Q/BCP
LKALEGLNTKVIGVSSDSVESHQKFSDEYDLTYPLLADVDKKLAKKFEVVNMIGIYKRTTFIISKEQKIMKVFPKVKVDGHVERIVEYLKDID